MVDLKQKYGFVNSIVNNCFTDHSFNTKQTETHQAVLTHLNKNSWKTGFGRGVGVIKQFANYYFLNINLIMINTRNNSTLWNNEKKYDTNQLQQCVTSELM